MLYYMASFFHTSFVTCWIFQLADVFLPIFFNQFRPINKVILFSCAIDLLCMSCFKVMLHLLYLILIDSPIILSSSNIYHNRNIAFIPYWRIKQITKYQDQVIFLQILDKCDFFNDKGYKYLMISRIPFSLLLTNH